MTGHNHEHRHPKLKVALLTLAVPYLIIRCAKQNVILENISDPSFSEKHYDAYPNSLVLHPRLLRGVRDAACTRKAYKGIRIMWYRVHLPEERHEQRRLTRTRRAHHEVDPAALKHNGFFDLESEPPSRRPFSGSRCVRVECGVFSSPCEGRMDESEHILILYSVHKGSSGRSCGSFFFELVQELSLDQIY